MLKVASIGLGRMGGAMARRFAAAGFELTVWNRGRHRAEEIAAETGAKLANSAAEAASDAEVVITSLADDAALRHVYLEANGVVEGIGSGAVAVDTSTVDPETILLIGEALTHKGATLVDGPVSGSVSTVDAGMLTIMAGGDAEAIDRVEPVLEAMSKRVIRVGPLGSGAASKLAVNSLLHGLNIALSEALVLAERSGIDRETAYEVFASGAAGAPFLEYKREAYTHPEQTPVAFSLDLVEKDLDLITSLGRRVGAPMQQAESGLDLVREAIENGMADDDLSAVAVYLRRRAG